MYVYKCFLWFVNVTNIMVSTAINVAWFSHNFICIQYLCKLSRINQTYVYWRQLGEKAFIKCITILLWRIEKGKYRRIFKRLFKKWWFFFTTHMPSKTLSGSASVLLCQLINNSRTRYIIFLFDCCLHGKTPPRFKLKNPE